MANWSRRPYQVTGTGCWISDLKPESHGYIRVYVGGGRSNKHTGLLHRLWFESTVGPIDSRLVLHHRCREKRCFNPDHLQAVTRVKHLELHAHSNAERSGKVCRQGHDLSLRGKPNPLNPERWTICMECKRLWAETDRSEKVR